MELRPPASVASTPTVNNNLQREAVERVTKRYENQEHSCKDRIVVACGIKTIIELILLLVLAGVIFYAWWRGIFDGGLNTRLDDELARLEEAGLPVPTESENKVSEVSPNEVSASGEEDGDDYFKVVRQFRKAEVDYWKNALNVDRVGKNAGSIKYWCLVVDEGNLPVILELSIAKGTKMNVRRLSASNGLVDSSVAEFERFTAKSPYLVMREGRAYFASKGKERLPVTVSAPQKGGALNPAQLEFGGLYAIFTELKMPPPRFAYDVLFEVKGGDPVLKVATVRFGEDVSYDQFFSKVAEHYDLSESEAMAIDAVLKMGKARIVPAEAQAKR